MENRDFLVLHRLKIMHGNMTSKSSSHWPFFKKKKSLHYGAMHSGDKTGAAISNSSFEFFHQHARTLILIYIL